MPVARATRSRSRCSAGWSMDASQARRGRSPKGRAIVPFPAPVPAQGPRAGRDPALNQAGGCSIVSDQTFIGKGMMGASLLSRGVSSLAAKLDRRYGWDKLPLPLGIFTLAGLRERLRAENLYDTNTPGGSPEPSHGAPADLEVRSTDGTYNDLERPQMGSVEARFGRNVPLDRAFPEP